MMDKSVERGFKHAREAVDWHKIYLKRSIMAIRDDVDKKVGDALEQLAHAVLDVEVETSHRSESSEDSYDMSDDDQDEESVKRPAPGGRQQLMLTAKGKDDRRTSSTYGRGRRKSRQSSRPPKKSGDEYQSDSQSRDRSQSAKGSNTKPPSLLKSVKARLMGKSKDGSQTRSDRSSSRAGLRRKSSKKRARPNSGSTTFSSEPKRKKHSAKKDKPLKFKLRDLISRRSRSSGTNSGDRAGSASTEGTAGADTEQTSSSTWGDSGYDNGGIYPEDAKRYHELRDYYDNGRATGRHEYNKD